MEAGLAIAFDILSFSSIIVLVVLGLGVIASMMGIFNFAHGEFLLLGGYTAYLFHAGGLPVWMGIVAAPFVVAFVGAAFWAKARMKRGDLPPHHPILPHRVGSLRKHDRWLAN